MTDEEMIARARRVVPLLSQPHPVIVDKLAAELLRQMADRLEESHG